MLKVLKNQGFASLVEVIITAVIFMLAAFGIFTTISMLRAPQGTESIKRLKAIYLAKAAIDDISRSVDAAHWHNAYTDTNMAAGHTYDHFIPEGFTAETGYYVNYYLEDVPSGSNLPLRKIYMNVYYPD